MQQQKIVVDQQLKTNRVSFPEGAWEVAAVAGARHTVLILDDGSEAAMLLKK